MRARVVCLAISFLVLVTGCPDDGGTPAPPARYLAAQMLYPAGEEPVGIAVHDFDGNGSDDIAIGNRASGTVTISLGNDDGTFADPVAYPAAFGINSIFVHDITGDGSVDIVTVNTLSDSISVLPGGELGSAVTTALPAGANALGAAAGELTGDGRVDLAVASSGLNGVTLLRGRGDGGFTNAGVVPTGGGGRSVLLRDYDGDGDLDLYAVSLTSNSFTLHLNDGGGGFLLLAVISVGEDPRDLVLDDFNGDAYLDLVVSNSASGDFSFIAGTATGFAAEVRFDFDGRPTRLIASDFNGDGERDIAAIRFRETTEPYALGQVGILLGSGSGTFAPARFFGLREQSLNLAAGDFNGDGKTDIASANPETDDFSVILGRGNGTFETDERFGVGDAPRFIASGDFNRDQKIDLAVANLNSNDLSILLGKADGSFQPERIVAIGEDPRALAVGRINADDNADIAVAAIDSSRALVLLGRGDGTFQTPKPFVLRTTEQIADNYQLDPRAIQLGDVDKDGNLDIITANSEADNVSVIFGDGTGEFSAPAQYFVSNFPNDLRVADMNGDGFLDVAVANAVDPTPGVGEPRVNVVFGDGEGFGGERTAYQTQGIPREMLLADLDGDGDRDVVTSNTQKDAQTVSVLAGRSGGKLSAGTRQPSGLLPESVTAGDVNGDGRLDILTTNATESVSVLIGRAGLIFSPPVNYYFGRDPIYGIALDLNNDRKTDFAAVNQFTGELSVLLGR